MSGKNLIPVKGNNFSGRSDYLKSLRLPNKNANSNYLYIGEQPQNHISGIFPTVEQEISFHKKDYKNSSATIIDRLFLEFDFLKHSSKNPFVLSGGEQTILVVLSCLLLTPEILAVDTTFEQLDKKWSEQLLAALKQDFFSSKIYFSDNRLDEYNITDLPFIHPPYFSVDYKYKFEHPQFEQMKISELGPNNIEIVDISFSYLSNQPVFENLNFQLESGNIYHLKGANGAGKSTLAKLLTGIIKPNKGKMLINGNDYNAYKFPGSMFGYSFQSPDEQLFSSTVENEILKYNKNEAISYTSNRELYIRLFGLVNIRKCHPAELPFVMRKRISIASTLAKDKPWYILDEPTLGQDSSFLDFFVKLVNSLVTLGKGVIIISHSEQVINKLNCKVLTLN